jgi:F-type H+-transporting ATPase subunit a
MNVIEHISAKVIFPLKLFGFDISVTNEIIVLWLAVLLICLFFYFSSRAVKLVPGKLQSIAELYVTTLWEYIEAIIKEKSWLPFFCALFSLIFFCNLLGIVPGLLPPTVNINFTATLAIMIFLLTQIVGIKMHGVAKYSLSFVPSGVPWPVLIFIVPVEIISQLARPFSLAIRLFANLFAGHAVILTIVSMIFIYKSYWVIPGSLMGNLVISAFEIFVALIQAFIFTFLSAFYIGSALNPEH